MIQVGSVVIISHDNYWRCLEEIKRIEDKISRGIEQVGVLCEGDFSKSVGGDLMSHDDKKYLKDLQEAVKLFEEKYPKK